MGKWQTYRKRGSTPVSDNWIVDPPIDAFWDAAGGAGTLTARWTHVAPAPANRMQWQYQPIPNAIALGLQGDQISTWYPVLNSPPAGTYNVWARWRTQTPGDPPLSNWSAAKQVVVT